MSYIDDAIRGGIWPLQHFESKGGDYSIANRIARRAARVERNDENDGMLEVPGTLGDVVGGYMWDFKDGVQRQEPAWSFAFPMVITSAKSKKTKKGGVGATQSRGQISGLPTGGFGGRRKGPGRSSANNPQEMLPTLNKDFEPYKKGLATLSPNLPEFTRPMLLGWTGVVTATTNEDENEQVTHPAMLGLVSPDTLDGDFGDRVWEIKKDKDGNHLHDFNARLQTFWKVTKVTGAFGTDNALAWQFSPASSTPGGGGHGLVFNGGVIAAAAASRSGPLLATATCQHPLGSSPSGVQFPLHISESG